MNNVKPLEAKGKSSITRLIASILVCESIGGIGSFFTINSVSTWYSTLEKPWFTPPNWLFGPIWISLFFLMGISLYFLWINYRISLARGAILAFGIQLGLNLLWTILFFGLRLLFIGVVEILVLWLAIAATIILSYKVNKVAGLLLIPYIVWVSTATLLNYYVWILNPLI